MKPVMIIKLTMYILNSSEIERYKLHLRIFLHPEDQKTTTAIGTIAATAASASHPETGGQTAERRALPPQTPAGQPQPPPPSYSPNPRMHIQPLEDKPSPQPWLQANKSNKEGA